MHIRSIVICLFISYAVAFVPEVRKSQACISCEFFVEALHNIWGEEAMGDCIGDLVTLVCTAFKIEDHFICKGMISDFKDEFMWITGQLIVEPKQLCGLLIAEDCDTFFNPLNQTWDLPLPGVKPPVVQPQQPKSGLPTLKVLHLSDLHIDMLYTPGLEAKCGEPQCCRPQKNPDEVGDAPIQQPAGFWGTVGNCDAPYYLVTNMLHHIQTTHPDLDYIVVSGDLMSHADWDYTHDSHAAMVRNVSNTIRSYFPKIDTFFAVGNHEGVPIDNFAPHFAPKEFNMTWLYGAMADSWKGWIPDDQDEMVRFNGCFMKKLFPGLRVISLNNGLGDPMNFYLYINQTDPDGTMTWFFNQLYDAEKAGDKVHVVAHIPGGSSEAYEGWASNYYRAINRFENTVSGQFFGHEHSEEYYVTYEDMNNARSRPTSVIFSGPSITPYSEYNPAYRVYTIDGKYKGSTYEVLDFEEWYMDLETANKDPNNANWKNLYSSAVQSYGLKDCSAGEWNNLIEKMKTDDSLFNKYRQNYYRRTNLDTCDSGCRNGFLCDCRQAHHSDALCSDMHVVKENTGKPSNRKMKKVMPTIPTKRQMEQLIKTRDTDKCPL